MALLLNRNTYIKKEHEKIILAKIDTLNELYISYKSLTTYFNLTWLKLIYFDYTGSNKELLETSKAYLQNYKDHIPTGKVSTYVLGVQIYQTKALLLNRQYNEARKYAREIRDTITGANWFLICEYKFKALLNNQKIAEAKQVITTVKKHPQYRATNILTKERWMIYEAYVELYEAYINKHAPKYRIAKLNNDLKETIKDKAGFNLSLRVLECIDLLYKNKWTKLIAQTEALNTYYKRHLNAKPFLRAKLFLKLVFSIEKYNFDYKKLEKCEEYIELKTNYYNHVLHESEIVNYDTLWKIILYFIKKQQQIEV